VAGQSRAKLSGWTTEEKFERETAWIDRAAKRDQRLKERDTAASLNSERRRFGVVITSVIVGWPAFEAHLPALEAMAMGAGVYVGVTMAAGLAWKW
jgi:hypothetical protein